MVWLISAQQELYQVPRVSYLYVNIDSVLPWGKIEVQVTPEALLGEGRGGDGEEPGDGGEGGHHLSRLLEK